MSTVQSYELLQLDGIDRQARDFRMPQLPEWHENVALFDIICRLGFHQDHFDEGRSFSCEQSKYFQLRCHDLPMLMTHSAVFELEAYWESKTKGLNPSSARPADS